MSKLIKPTRRGFISGLAVLVTAPAIVRASSLMPVRSMLHVGGSDAMALTIEDGLVTWSTFDSPFEVGQIVAIRDTLYVCTQSGRSGEHWSGPLQP